MRSRRAPRKCRVCGKEGLQSSDLCPACRRDTAEGLRRAATERADQARAEEKQRHDTAQEKERLWQAQLQEQARLRQLEEARHQQDEARLRHLEEAARQRREAADAFQETFDPYAILGVQRGAAREAIDAAYQDARSKYDPDQVGYLGDELQEHFKSKAKAVERAYQLLTESA